MKLKYIILFQCLFLLITVFFTFGCNQEDDTYSPPVKDPGAVIEPDADPSDADPNKCSKGGKSPSGSGMTLSCSKNEFAKINRDEYAPDEVLVKFKDGTSDMKSSQIMKKFGFREVQDIPSVKKGRLKKIKLNDGISVKEAIAQYKSQPDVEYAEPNYIYRIKNTPNDPNFNEQWGLKNTDVSTNVIGINAVKAWEKFSNGVNCKAVIVAVIDTGINYKHRDFTGNMWDGRSKGYPNHGYNFADKNNNPMDLNGHGTHCAGIIGARGNDGIGITGVCWEIQIMAVKALDATGGGYVADIVAGIRFAVDNGAHIINASFAGSESKTIRDAVLYAQAAGVIIVAAAGNEKTDNPAYSYPAAYSINTNINNVISVGAIDQSGELADFSNYGNWVDIAAPGVNILSTWPGQSVVTREDFTDWIRETDWGTGTYRYTSSSGDAVDIDIDMLTNPPAFTGTYSNNLRSMAIQVFDLNAYGAVSAVASYYADININSGIDYLYFMMNANGGRPTVSLDRFTGNYSGLIHMGDYDLTRYIDRNISLGFNFVTSNIPTSNRGVGIAWFDVTRLYPNNTACLYARGTSMATPYVAGVAALSIQWYINKKGSYSKTADYTKIIESIDTGASTYSGGNSIGSGSGIQINKMLNASGALDKIN